MFLAINEMLKEKSRFILIAAVIVLTSYLVFFLTGLAYGLASSYTTAIDEWDATGIILNKSANDNVSRSLISKADYESVVGGDVAPLGVGVATIKTGDVGDVALFGVESDSFLSPQVENGRMAASNDEIVVAGSLEKAGVKLGDRLKLEGGSQEYTVVGFIGDVTFQTTPVVYMSIKAWRGAVSETSGMVGMRDDSTISALVTRGPQRSSYNTDKISWQPIKDFIYELPGYEAQVLTFSLMISFLVGIASLVLAIFIYILTIQKKSIFGVLKAEGVPSSYIGWSVMVQVVTLSLFGLALGMALAVATGLPLAPDVPFSINPLFFVAISVLFLACAVLGGLASVRSVSKIDPVEAIG